MRKENFTFEIGHQLQTTAAGAQLVFDSIYYPERDTVTVHVFLNQKDADSNTPIENNPHFAFRFIIRSAPRFPGNETKDLYPWTPPGSEDKDLPLSFEQDITRALERLGVTAGILDVTLVPFDPEGVLQDQALDIRGGVKLEIR